MFTGMIEEVGTVRSLRREGKVARLALQAARVRDDLRVGDSLATNGVCLTVERIDPAALLLSMMPETLQRTTLGTLAPGRHVNLERALPLNGRLGGHLVAGHVDGIGRIARISGAGEERVIAIAMPPDLARFITPQGSIAVDGISLTVVDASAESFSVSLIRHTMGTTTLGELAPGMPVNLEVDLIARYLERLLAGRPPDGLTFDHLRTLGY